MHAKLSMALQAIFTCSWTLIYKIPFMAVMYGVAVSAIYGTYHHWRTEYVLLLLLLTINAVTCSSSKEHSGYLFKNVKISGKQFCGTNWLPVD